MVRTSLTFESSDWQWRFWATFATYLLLWLLSGGETWIDPQGGDLSGCRLIWRGSRTKSVGGSSRVELGTRQEWRWTLGFRLVRASIEWNPTSSMGWNYVSKGSPLEWSSRPPYMVNGLGVTPGFKGKSECKNTYAPGSSYTHAST
jgi:hypothetical protein